MILKDKLKGIEREVIDIRRQLHKIPELGFKEFKTQKFIIEYLKELDLEVLKVAKTGVLGFLKGEIGTRTIAIRADIDALPIREKTNLEYSSVHEGIMHACGHDGHTAIALGLAKYLSELEYKIKDNILFIFQPAEEGPGGAEVIVNEGILEKFNVDIIFGLHLYPEIEHGRAAVRSGPIMAQTGEFDITIKGKSGHGAIPQNSIDSIVIASNLIINLQTIISRNISPISSAVLTIGKIYGGERRNVIAEEVTLEGTIRAFDEGVYNTVKKRIKDLALSLEKGFNCNVEVAIRDMYPPVNNNKELTDMFFEVIDNVEEIDPQMISEDFSYYQRQIPGLFFLLGVGNKDRGYIYPLHNPMFNFDEGILLRGIEIYIKLLNHLGAI